MQESLLHYLWQFQYFDHTELSTSTGDPVIITHPGFRNTNSGPDFYNSRIKIQNINWFGSVEIHIQSSGWLAHKHQHDDAYDNVILHVVWENDVQIRRKDGSAIPTIELRNRVSLELLEKYQRIIFNPGTLPCESSIADVSEIVKMSMIERALMNRLESKSREVNELLASNHQDWEETAYQLMSRNFGFKVNNDPFFQLAKSLPYKFIRKHSDKIIQIEALLFGQAGFLEDDYGDDYYALLKREFIVLNKKFSLLERRMNKSQWKLLRLRPANFPTMRIAQLASVIHSKPHLMSEMLAATTYKELYSLFSVTTSEYWKTHYLFSKAVKEQVPPIGKMSIDNLIINSVIPMLVAYGKSRDEQQFTDRALSILEEITAESNLITRRWIEVGVRVKSACDSQGLIELYNNFCLRKRCLDCNIGSVLIRPVIHEFS